MKRAPRKSSRARATMKPFRKMLRAQRQPGTVLHYVPSFAQQVSEAAPPEPTVFGERITRGEDGVWRIIDPKTAPPQKETADHG